MENSRTGAASRKLLRFSKRFGGSAGRRTGCPAPFVIARKVSPCGRRVKAKTRPNSVSLLDIRQLRAYASRFKTDTVFASLEFLPCPELHRPPRTFGSRRQPPSGIAPSVHPSAPRSRRLGRLGHRRTTRSGLSSSSIVPPARD